MTKVSGLYGADGYIILCNTHTYCIDSYKTATKLATLWNKSVWHNSVIKQQLRLMR